MKPATEILRSLVSAFFLLTLVTRSCSSIKLDSDGGYHVDIHIKSETLDPEKSEEHIERLKTQLNGLASLMYESTEQQFYLKTVSIFIPESWTHSTSDIETRPGYSVSDIKISDDTSNPHVIKPGQCFLPGDEIKLPSTLLIDENDRAKSLLHLWAEYRWGVFDESGLHGNSRSPYFFQNFATSKWEVSSCFNDEVAGSYKLYDEMIESGELCNVDNINVPLNESCRFVPDETGNELIVSSLMNQFYEMSSINSFCNAESHQILYPTKHNIYCGYRSTWDVIRESLDWKAVSQPVNALPAPTFSLVKISAAPLVYYLIDSRTVPIPNEALESVTETLKSGLFGRSITNDIMGALAKCPGNQKAFEEIIPWTLMKDAGNQFQEALDATISSDTLGNGDFPSALKSIILSINAQNHESGAYIFVFKGSQVLDYGESPFEEELVSILTESKIKLYAIEVKLSSFETGTNLLNLATKSNGKHLVLSDMNSINTLLPSFVSDFVDEALSPQFDPFSSSTVFRNLLPSTEPFTIDLRNAVNGQLSISLTADGLSGTKSRVTVNGTPIELKPMEEYNESSSKGKRVKLISENISPQTSDILTVESECEVTDCQILLVITEQRSFDPSIPALHISTSANNDIFNGTDQPKGLSAFVKLETAENLFSDYKALEASASLCLVSSTPLKCWEISLNDNGGGAPDLMEGDGIISGTFVPSEVGSYRIIANIYFEQETNSNSVGIFKQVEYPNLVVVTELTSTDNVVPSRVMNFMIKEISGYSVILTWNAPAVFTSDGPRASETYEIRDCDSAEKVISDFSSCILLSEGTPGSPFSPEELSLTFNDDESLHFIALHSSYEGSFSEPSNFIVATKQDPQPTEPSTSTLAPATTETSVTTETPTVSTSPGTTESGSTSLGTTETATVSTSPETTATSFTTPEGTTETGSSTSPENESTSLDPSSTTTSSEPDITTPEPELTTTTSPTTSASPRTPPVPDSPEETVYFFKRPEGYATIGGIVLVTVVGVGAAVGYLVWKRNMLIKSGKLP